MLTLVFDTATRWGRFALAEDGRLLDYRPVNVSGNYADALLPVIDEMLAQAGRRLDEVRLLGVTTGPGSFTGVRIGVATAKGLAYGLSCELVAVSSLAAMAGALLAEHPESEYAVPALDARRGEVYAAVFRRRGSWVESVVPASGDVPDVWWRRILAAVPDPECPVYGGDGTGLLLGQGETLRPELAARGVPARRPWSAAHPSTARALAVALGAADFPVPPVHPFVLVPNYLRASDAEIKYSIDLTPRRPDPFADSGDGNASSE